MTINPWIFALVLLGAGLLLGEIAGRVARASMSRPRRSPEVREMARPVGTFLFWAGTAVGLLMAVASASPETLERIPDETLHLLPDLLVALLFLIAGYAVSVGLAAAVGQSALRASGVRQRGLERLMRVAIMAAAIVLALGQLGVDTTILVILLAAFLGGPTLAIALLTGLGGRQVASNLAAGRALRGQLQVDRWLSCEGPDGQLGGIIVAVHPATVELLTADAGTVHVPLSRLLDQPFQVQGASVGRP